MRYILIAIIGILVLNGCENSQDTTWIDMHKQRNWYVQNYPDSKHTWLILQIPMRQHLAYCDSKVRDFHHPDSELAPHAKCQHIDWLHEAPYGFYWLDR